MAAGAFETACEEALARYDVPGAAVGVLRDGAVETHGFGVLDVRSGVPVTPESDFRIASVTKPFTATLALYLSLSGVIAMDDVVPGRDPEVTVQHLLSHLGGFEGERGDLARFGEDDDALPRLVEELADQRQLLPPDEVWSYCNAGYWLVAQFLADRLDGTYEDVLTDWVLRPLGLANTGFGAPAAVGHDGGEPVLDDYPRARRASGGLVSDVGDLLAFARFHLETPETEFLRAPVVSTPNGDYGFGFALERVGEVELWGHDGDYGGFRSKLVLAPEHGFAFAGLANAGTAGAALEEMLDAALARELGVRRVPAPTEEVTQAEHEAVAGRYARADLELDVRAVDGGLEVDAVEIDRVTAARSVTSGLRARPLGQRLYALEGGDRDGERFDFHPLDGAPAFVRFGSVLTERTP